MPWSPYATPEKKAAIYKAHYEENKARILARKKARREENKDAHYLNHKTKWKLGHVRERAKRKGIEFTITDVHVAVPATCPILGIPLFFTPGKGTANSPSVDRLDPNKGYVPGNVWVISHRANTLKSNATSEELFKVARAVQLIEQMTPPA